MKPARTNFLRITGLAALAVALGIGPPAHGQEFQQLGLLPGGTKSVGNAVNYGGEVIVGTADTPVNFITRDRAVRWVAPGPLVDLGTLSGQPIDAVSQAHGVSANGQVVVGWSGAQANQPLAFRWTPSGGMEALPLLPGWPYSRALAVSNDGSIIAGGVFTMTTGSLARWLPSGPELLPLPTGYTEQSFGDMSGNGRVCVGWARLPSAPAFDALRWVDTSVDIILTDAVAFATNRDGSVIVGASHNSMATARRAFRWTPEGGAVDLPLPPGAPATYTMRATGVSDDGTVVVGDTDGPQGAFLWTEELGTVELNAWLQSRGVNLGVWVITHPTDVASDGCRIVITGLARAGLASFVPRAIRISICTDRDRDGDALCDDWELNGVPYIDADGNPQRYILDADGDGQTDASPMRKDLFIEVDTMAGRAPSQAALDMVVQAFDNAPVPAPDITGGLPGITMHIVRDELDLPLIPYPSPWTEFQIDKAAYFGTPAEQDHPDWEQIREAKAKAYRYCIFADTIRGRTTSGTAEGFGCNDFIVSLGALKMDGTPAWPNESGQPGGTAQMQAGTFMHELGHALGLRHGGSDSIGYKPNYYSVMNYNWQLPTPHNANWELRYSDAAAPPLDESALDEGQGCRLNLLGRVFPFTIPGGVGGCTIMSPCRLLEPMSGAVDWNDNGAIDPIPVAVNLNTGFAGSGNDPAGQVLLGHDDWSNLVYNFRNSPHFANGAPAADIGPEMDLEMREYLEAFAGGAPCPADWNNDTLVNSNDISAYLTAWLDSVTMGNLAADFNADNQVNSTDISSFLTAWLDAVQNGC